MDVGDLEYLYEFKDEYYMKVSTLQSLSRSGSGSVITLPTDVSNIIILYDESLYEWVDQQSEDTTNARNEKVEDKIQA
jgi:hypothetical protein